MKTRAFAVAAAAIVAWSAPARALDEVGDDIRAANNEVAASFVARHVSYDELNHGLSPGLPDVIDSEHGWIFGFLAELEIQRRIFDIPNVYLRPSFGATWGSLTYDGRTQPSAPGGSQPVTATSGARILDFGLDVGVGIPLGARAAITPILRYANRQWRRTLLDGSPSSFREDYAHGEIGGGLLAQFAIAERVVFGVTATMGYTLGPTVKITGTGSPVSNDLDLGNALAVHGGASLDWGVGATPLHAFVAYDLLYFRYGESAPQTVGSRSLAEPDSRSLQQDVRAGLAYAF